MLLATFLHKETWEISAASSDSVGSVILFVCLSVRLFFLMKRRKKINSTLKLTDHNLKIYLIEHLSYRCKKAHAFALNVLSWNTFVKTFVRPPIFFDLSYHQLCSSWNVTLILASPTLSSISTLPVLLSVQCMSLARSLSWICFYLFLEVSTTSFPRELLNPKIRLYSKTRLH